MTRYWFIIAVLLSAAGLHAQEENSRCYLLKTGLLVEGTATFDGQQHTVQTPFGSLNILAQNVEFIGVSKRDVYLYRRNKIEPTDCNALIRFAEWCISNGLTAEGIAEYHRAGQVAPQAALAGVIRQRLEMLQQIEHPSPTIIVPQANTPAVSRQMFENYVRRVQPLLVNRCLSADCHGTLSKQQLRIGIPQEMMGSTSRRNLQAVLAFVNLDNPMESPLLKGMITPHGEWKTALRVESIQYNQAALWVQQVAHELSPTPQPAAQQSDNIPAQVAALPEQFRQSLPREERVNLPEPTTKQGVFDPLDPEVFNDKYHRRLGVRSMPLFR